MQAWSRMNECLCGFDEWRPGTLCACVTITAFGLKNRLIPDALIKKWFHICFSIPRALLNSSIGVLFCDLNQLMELINHV